MAKIDLITLSGLTASDGSIISSGATIKFSTNFEIGNTNVRVYPQIFRNRELFELGFKHVEVTKETLPDDIYIQTLTEEEYYVLTPQKLYEIVRDWLNNYYGGEFVEINIILD